MVSLTQGQAELEAANEAMKLAGDVLEAEQQKHVDQWADELVGAVAARR